MTDFWLFAERCTYFAVLGKDVFRKHIDTQVAVGQYTDEQAIESLTLSGARGRTGKKGRVHGKDCFCVLCLCSKRRVAARGLTVEGL